MTDPKLIIVRLPFEQQHEIEKLKEALEVLIGEGNFIILPDWSVDRIEFEYPKNSNWPESDLEPFKALLK